VPFGHEKNTDGSTVGLMISLASVCYGSSQVTKKFFVLTLGLPNSRGEGLQHLIPSHCQQQNFTDGFLLEFDFFPGHCSDSYNSLPMYDWAQLQ
jgi:hypothetical protein